MTDVIRLVWPQALGGNFTRHIDRNLRLEFRWLIAALQQAQDES
jgi:hypothetical protein